MMVICQLRKLSRKLYKQIYSLYYRSFLGSCGDHVYFGGMNNIVGGKYISIGSFTTFQKCLYLTAWDRYRDKKFSPKIKIGKKCDFGAFNHITCINEIEIGDGVLTGKWVTITDNDHGGTSYKELLVRPQERCIISKGKVTIGKNVFIGDKATILSGVTIGEGAVIGANSVVSKDVPPFSVVVGNPAKVIKKSYKLNRNEKDESICYVPSSISLHS